VDPRHAPNTLKGLGSSPIRRRLPPSSWLVVCDAHYDPRDEQTFDPNRDLSASGINLDLYRLRGLSELAIV
jgi:hypothetical protein